ncbi:MAG: ABC transporter ATP-binding protein [Pseudonocardia sp.]|nr:ABC transporter ATP-binding protein [Pseudonocardia sp.]
MGRNGLVDVPVEVGEPALSVTGLGVVYGTPPAHREVLAGVELSVAAGEFVSVVGPSGAGKTTLIRCLAGLQQPSTGRVFVAGEPVTGPPSTLALVSQDYSRSLMPWLTVAENVRLPLRGKGIAREEQCARVDQALGAVGLADVRSSRPWQLSGGMQQRVSIARALAYQPRVLLMDEPFASVDAQTRADLEDLVLGLQRASGISVVLVTHDVDESVYLADRVVVLGGAPAAVAHQVEVLLGRERDQIRTKSLPKFVSLRAEVLEQIRRFG